MHSSTILGINDITNITNTTVGGQSKPNSKLQQISSLESNLKQLE